MNSVRMLALLASGPYSSLIILTFSFGEKRGAEVLWPAVQQRGIRNGNRNLNRRNRGKFAGACRRSCGKWLVATGMWHVARHLFMPADLQGNAKGRGQCPNEREYPRGRVVLFRQNRNTGNYGVRFFIALHRGALQITSNGKETR